MSSAMFGIKAVAAALAFFALIAIVIEIVDLVGTFVSGNPEVTLVAVAAVVFLTLAVLRPWR